MLKIKALVFNPFGENTYIVWDDETKECAVVDAGCLFGEEEDTLSHFIDSNRLKVKYLLATHLHLDHCFGCNYVSSKYGVKLTANPNDEYLLERMQSQAEMFGLKGKFTAPSIEHIVNEGDIFTLGKQQLKAIAVPGHSPGSIVYYNQEGNFILAGDVLFKESIGRTDLPGGNYKELAEGIVTKLFTLPSNTVVYTGHGSTTTIGYESDYNPYL